MSLLLCCDLLLLQRRMAMTISGADEANVVRALRPVRPVQLARDRRVDTIPESTSTPSPTLDAVQHACLHMFRRTPTPAMRQLSRRPCVGSDVALGCQVYVTTICYISACYNARHLIKTMSQYLSMK